MRPMYGAVRALQEGREALGECSAVWEEGQRSMLGLFVARLP